jgi:cytoskeletal protein RodZ
MKEHDSDFFIGARLAARRQKNGIALEKAALDIRISTDRLRQIEEDDFSSFAHPTYARLFLVDYANYLRVPLEEIRDYLPGSRSLGGTDNNYLQVLLARQSFLHGEQFQSLRRLLFASGGVLALVILVVLAVFGWRTWKKFERVKPQPVPQSAVLSTPTPTPRAALPATSSTPKSAATPVFSPTPSPTPSPKPRDADASPTPFTLPPFQPSSRPKPPQ